MLLLVALLLAGSAASLANPLFAGKVTEVLLADPNSSHQPVGNILLAWLLLLVIRAIIGTTTSYLIASTGEVISAELRSRVYEHSQTGQSCAGRSYHSNWAQSER